MRPARAAAVLLLAALAVAAPAPAQPAPAAQPAATVDPYPVPIPAAEGAVRVAFRDFATLPDVDTVPARMMHLVPEPGARALFVNDMRGPLYRVSADGRSVTPYLDVDDPRWGVDVQSSGRERGFQSFALHPQFNERGAPGHGKLYTWTDVVDVAPAPDFAPGGTARAQHTVLLEWTARDPAAATYDGGRPRELLRLQQPYANHNGGQLAFNPLARPGDPDFGMLYVGNADGGSGGDPLALAQNLASPFGKILRIDPLGRDAANGRYGIPADNPFAAGPRTGARGEVWALGVRNPQRLAWDPATGVLYVADVGQNAVEEVSAVPKGGNLGWNVWEGSFRFVSRAGVDTAGPRADPAMTYPVAEYDHVDPLLLNRAAASGLVVYRGAAIPQLRDRILFADNPSGELLHVAADDTTARGQAHVRRVLLDDGRGGEARTLLQVIRETNARQGRAPAARADLRLGTGHDGQVFLLNKADGVIRLLVGEGAG